MPLPLMAGRYQLEELLGRGGMGVVYRATDRRTGGAVAVKVLNPALALNPDYLERLRREARITASITSPRVVRVVDLDEHDGTPFLVLEYIAGPTLDQLLAEEGPFSEREAVTICLELARALEAAHALGIIHRDLKPENIKLVDGQVKVLDFGLARAEGDRGVTITGSYIGTPHYSAPERIAGRGDIRSDIYAVGVILFALLAGSPPFDGPTSVAILMQHASAPLPELPTESPPLRALMSCCMAKSPADRYQTPAALTAALGVVLRTLPHDTDVERGPHRVLPASERITPWLRHVDKSPSVAAALPEEGSGENHAATVTTRLTATPAAPGDTPATKTQRGAGLASRRRRLAAWAVAGAGIVLTTAAVAVTLVNRGGGDAPSTPSSSNIVYHPAAQSAVVTTLAGSGEAGLRDGPSDTAQFAEPVDVAVDSAGVVYVVDAARIRRISPAGVVATLAGSAETGFVDGPIATARFDNPRGIAVDGAGTLYIADRNNHRIRTISPDGVVRTLAGAGAPGFADGPGDRAQFNSPYDVAVDAAGTVYVADALNNRIRRISREGVVTTLAGGGDGNDLDGPGTRARFSFPTGLAVDTAGTVYVADTYNARIRAISPAGEVRTVAGSGEDGVADRPALEATFSDPSAIAVDRSGNLYVLDKSSRIRLIAPDGKVTTLAGSEDRGSENGAGNDARFDAPEGIAAGAAGKVYIADTANRRIRVVRWSP